MTVSRFAHLKKLSEDNLVSIADLLDFDADDIKKGVINPKEISSTKKLEKAAKSAVTTLESGKVSARAGKLQKKVFLQALIDLNKKIQALDNLPNDQVQRGVLEIIELLAAIDKFHVITERYDYQYHAKKDKKEVGKILQVYLNFRDQFTLSLSNLNKANKMLSDRFIESKFEDYSKRVKSDQSQIKFNARIIGLNHTRKKMGKRAEKKTQAPTTTANPSSSSISSTSSAVGGFVSNVKSKAKGAKDKAVDKAKGAKDKAVNKAKEAKDKAQLLAARADEFKKGTYIYKESVWINFLDKLDIVNHPPITAQQFAELDKAIKSLIYSTKNVRFLTALKLELDLFYKEFLIPLSTASSMSAPIDKIKKTITTTIDTAITRAKDIKEAKKAIKELENMSSKGETTLPAELQKKYDEEKKKFDDNESALLNLRKRTLPAQFSIDERLKMLSEMISNSIQYACVGIEAAKSGLVQVQESSRSDTKKKLTGIATSAVETVAAWGVSQLVGNTIDNKKKIEKVMSLLSGKAKQYTEKRFDKTNTQIAEDRRNGFYDIFHKISKQDLLKISNTFTLALYARFPFAIEGVFLPSAHPNVAREFFDKIFKYIYDSFYHTIEKNDKFRQFFKNYDPQTPLPNQMISEICQYMIKSVCSSANRKAVTGSQGIVRENITMDLNSYRTADLLATSGMAVRKPDGTFNYYQHKNKRVEALRVGFEVIDEAELAPGSSVLRMHLDGKNKEMDNRYQTYVDPNHIKGFTSQLSPNQVLAEYLPTAHVSPSTSATANTSSSSSQPQATPTVTVTTTAPAPAADLIQRPQRRQGTVTGKAPGLHVGLFSATSSDSPSQTTSVTSNLTQPQPTASSSSTSSSTSNVSQPQTLAELQSMQQQQMQIFMQQQQQKMQDFMNQLAQQQQAFLQQQQQQQQTFLQQQQQQSQPQPQPPPSPKKS